MNPALLNFCPLKLVWDCLGILPENGKVCQTVYDYFPDPSIADPALSALDGEDGKLSRSAQSVAEIYDMLAEGLDLKAFQQLIH
ncbi:hypothetical protein FB451DRAFT_1555667 [Mycena latifolia]|nr:hypothetical protein FB451DRAFT_1555667 [Mycena latifolia]